MGNLIHLHGTEGSKARDRTSFSLTLGWGWTWSCLLSPLPSALHLPPWLKDFCPLSQRWWWGINKPPAQGLRLGHPPSSLWHLSLLKYLRKHNTEAFEGRIWPHNISNLAIKDFTAGIQERVLSALPEVEQRWRHLSRSYSYSCPPGSWKRQCEILFFLALLALILGHHLLLKL